MNRFYHQRFFSDIRFTTISLTLLFVLGAWQIELAYLLIPPLAVMGAVQTAFDASYLIFSRQYSTALERRLNEATRSNVLVAHEMENQYLFPLGSTKVVTFAPGTFTWFGFMTLFYTAAGVAALVFGLALGWNLLVESGSLWTFTYLVTVGVLLVSSLIAGWWWFVTGVGERRIATIVERATL